MLGRRPRASASVLVTVLSAGAVLLPVSYPISNSFRSDSYGNSSCGGGAISGGRGRGRGDGRPGSDSSNSRGRCTAEAAVGRPAASFTSTAYSLGSPQPEA